jgi:hypothetical protein
MIVKVGKMPGVIKEVLVESGATVEQALDAAEISASGYSIIVGDSEVSLSTTLSENDTVVLSKKIEGNR